MLNPTEPQVLDDAAVMRRAAEVLDTIEDLPAEDRILVLESACSVVRARMFQRNERHTYARASSGAMSSAQQQLGHFSHGSNAPNEA